MAIQVVCPKCRHQMEVGDEFAGQMAMCATCSELISVPAPAGAGVAAPGGGLPAADAAELAEIAAVPQRERGATFNVVYLMTESPGKSGGLPKRLGSLRVTTQGITVKDLGPAANPAGIAAAGVAGGALGGLIFGVVQEVRMAKARTAGVVYHFDPAATRASFDPRTRMVSLSLPDGRWLALQPGAGPQALASPQVYQGLLMALGRALGRPLH